MIKNKIKSLQQTDRSPSPRGAVLAILGAITLGVAILSVSVSYQILEPRFGGWAVPTVGALDALWVVFQATEILSGNNRSRSRRVQYAGLALTVVNAAIPTADLIMSGPGGFDLAMVITPIAISMTKLAWWIVLPSLGRKTSAVTRGKIADKRQEVADHLETMEAEAAHRIELLELATELEQRVGAAETTYRLSVLASQQAMTEALHTQAVATAQTVQDKVLPPSVGAIRLPELGQWNPTAPALPGTVARDGSGTPAIGRHDTGMQVNGLPQGSGAIFGTPFGTPFGMGGVPVSGNSAHQPTQATTLADLAAVAGVPVPQPGERLSDTQIDVVLRHLRYLDDPPLSYRQAMTAFREAGYVGSEERVRRVFAALMAKEHAGRRGDGGSESSWTPEEGEEESEDASA